MENLSLLGQGQTAYPQHYSPQLLEAFNNRHPDQDYLVRLHCPEFTSLCPITGQPDFATLRIGYIPHRQLVESKALKLYLFSFRSQGEFHEDCVNRIKNDLVALLAPKYLEVEGIFTPRGGIAIHPFANYANPQFGYEDFRQQRMLAVLP